MASPSAKLDKIIRWMVLVSLFDEKQTEVQIYRLYADTFWPTPCGRLRRFAKGMSENDTPEISLPKRLPSNLARETARNGVANGQEDVFCGTDWLKAE